MNANGWSFVVMILLLAAMIIPSVDWRDIKREDLGFAGFLMLISLGIAALIAIPSVVLTHLFY